MFIYFFIFAAAVFCQLTQVGNDLEISSDGNVNHPVHLDSGRVANFYYDYINDGNDIAVRVLDPQGDDPSFVGSAVVIRGNSTSNDTETLIGTLHIGGERVLVHFYSPLSGDSIFNIVDCVGSTCTIGGTPLSVPPPANFNPDSSAYGADRDRGVYLGRSRAVVVQQSYRVNNYQLNGFVLDTAGDSPTVLSGPTLLASGGCTTACPFSPEASLIHRTGDKHFVLTYGMYTEGVSPISVIMGQKCGIEGGSITLVGDVFDISRNTDAYAAYNDNVALFGGEGYLLVLFGGQGVNPDDGNSSYEASVTGVIYDTTANTPTPTGPLFILSSPDVYGYQWAPTGDAFRSHRAFVVSWSSIIEESDTDFVFSAVYCFDRDGQPTPVTTAPVQIASAPPGVTNNVELSSTTVSGTRVTFTWKEFTPTNDALLAGVYEADLSSCSVIPAASTSAASEVSSLIF